MAYEEPRAVAETVPPERRAAKTRDQAPRCAADMAAAGEHTSAAVVLTTRLGSGTVRSKKRGSAKAAPALLRSMDGRRGSCLFVRPRPP